jgi:hypothetical protein
MACLSSALLITSKIIHRVKSMKYIKYSPTSLLAVETSLHPLCCYVHSH